MTIVCVLIEVNRSARPT